MKILSDQSTLVLAGLWNRFIFTPEWVHKFLLPGVEITAEFPINLAGSFRISSNEIRLFVVGRTLNLVSIQTTDAVYEQIQDVALKIARFLPHTPVTAFGVNFIYEGYKEELDFDVFDLADKKRYLEWGHAVANTTLKHELNIEESTLTISIAEKENSVNFNFNFNFDVESLVAFQTRIADHSIINLSTLSNEILEKLYLKT